ncbi:MAG: hypothetical protein GC129_02565 [Proteobacteria bacterium]|nr:hypothetical protein [Pseudomonadota bacterium]
MGLTKSGYQMNPKTLERILSVAGDVTNTGLSHRALAARARVGVRTLRDYLTEEVKDQIEARLKGRPVEADELLAVDRAMLAKARAGSVAAARLLYMRLGAVKPEEASVPSLEELEAEVKALREKIPLE